MPHFPNTHRVDARDKVRGAAPFGTDMRLPEMTHGAFVTATIGRGRITGFDLSAARALSGVRLIVTNETTSALTPARFIMVGGYAMQSHSPVLTDRVAYRGQPVALVVADSLEIAKEAAGLIRVSYQEEAFAATLDSPLAEVIPQADAEMRHPPENISIGDAAGTFERAAHRVDATYEMARQYQNPIELVGSVAYWEGDRLTVHQGTQNANGCRFNLATQLGIPPENVTVISPYVGGGFGQKNAAHSQEALTAFAAREIGRPVKVVVPRRQLFHDASSRPATRQRLRLSADAEGRLTSMLYDIDAETSRHDNFAAEHADTIARFYDTQSFQSHARLAKVDMATPGYMRAPFELAASFAVESAIDELAHELGIDPVEMRLRNDSERDMVTGLPHSSRHLAECLRRGAERFGWQDRNPEPRSMRAENGDLIGYGVGVGLYNGSSGANIVSLRAERDGAVVVSAGVHEMGQGVRTAIANVVATRLGVATGRVEAILGDTRGVPAMLTAGSWGSAAAIPAVEAACDALLARLAERGADIAAEPDLDAFMAQAGQTSLAVESDSHAPGQTREVLGNLRAGYIAPGGPVYPGFVTFSYAAHFVEVRVEPSTGRVRVPRVVSTFDCGRVLSPVTARSQGIGGIVWGIGGTLREGAEIDPRYGGVLNADIAEYLVPVNADVGSVDIDFIDEPDFALNRSGVKGLGEVVLAGTAPAITNAIFHATGKRVRSLPVRMEHLI
ncbi:xanthine dehydrogenase family protein molybdopterin-binding subunit [Arenibacterium sp. LLYu02]|uniref:xanthine dehydrogenase family protein molybdopterin-binding subunit n=1 Tax=Arenibacterium sp. LLYu02 TaxID=3404132 RepID=UPI003B2137DE